MKYPLLFIAIFLASSSNGQNNSQPVNCSNTIDQRIELVSIVYRLSGAPEYTHVDYPDKVFHSYIDAIEQHFRKYEAHPAVKYARKLKSKGIGYNYVMYLPLIISNPPDMEIMRPFGLKKTQ